MSAREVTRRAVLAAAGAVPVAAAGAAAEAPGPPASPGSAAPPPAGAPRELDLSTPEAQLRAYLKLFLSLERATIFYTYQGTLTAAVPGRGVVPLLATTSVVRRLVEPEADGWRVTIWEATVYHRPGDTEPLDRFENPLNGRVVQPFHQREGGNQTLYTVNGQFALRDGRRIALGGGPKPFSREWHRAGDRIWTARETAGVYAKSPFDPATWPLEHAGPDLQYSEKTTNSGFVHELADPSVVCAGSTYSLNQVMLWWPWLLMGRQPGFLVWNTQGVKLPSLDTLAPASRRLVERAHPYLFGDAAPWQGYVSLWTEYPKQRRPAQ